MTVALVSLTAVAGYWWKKTEYQRRADAMEWRWSEEKALPEYCAGHNLQGYTAKVHSVGWTEVVISFWSGTEEVYAHFGDGFPVFIQFKDVLYIADCLETPKCRIVAYDLKAQKELWVCPLRGSSSTYYPSSLNIEVDGGAILIFGKTMDDRFIEYVDPDTGKSVGHKKLPPK
jgi:hypothetical protein